MYRLLAKTTGALIVAVALATISAGAFARDAADGKCREGDTLKAGDGKDLAVIGTCKVDGTVKDGLYNYGEINIYGKGKLIFSDARIDFWAKSIIVENGGELLAGKDTAPIAGPVTIHLYGKD